MAYMLQNTNGKTKRHAPTRSLPESSAWPSYVVVKRDNAPLARTVARKKRVLHNYTILSINYLVDTRTIAKNLVVHKNNRKNVVADETKK